MWQGQRADAACISPPTAQTVEWHVQGYAARQLGGCLGPCGSQRRNAPPQAHGCAAVLPPWLIRQPGTPPPCVNPLGGVHHKSREVGGLPPQARSRGRSSMYFAPLQLLIGYRIRGPTG